MLVSMAEKIDSLTFDEKGPNPNLASVNTVDPKGIEND